MEAAVGRPRRALPVAAALLALGFMAAMVILGHLPETRWLVKFEPAGPMRETPDQIDRVELEVAGRRSVFVRTPAGWRTERASGPVSTAVGAHLDASLRFMHVSSPTRVLEGPEYKGQGLREFGLAPPRCAVVLYRGGRVVLGTSFGSPNPQGVLQYMRLEGRDALYLMPRFVGEEWERVLERAPRP